MIDWIRIDQLKDEIGPECFDEVVDLFLEEVETELDELGQGVEQNMLGTRLHFLKGSALNLGFTVFSKLCQEAEVAHANGAPEQVDVNAIVSCYANSKTAFLQGLQR